jgi:hypothetical protein
MEADEASGKRKALAAAQQAPKKRQKKKNDAAGNIDIFGKDAWDDSELIAAWDQGIAEYKRYHSSQPVDSELVYSEYVSELPQESSVVEIHDGQLEQHDNPLNSQDKSISRAQDTKEDAEDGEIDDYAAPQAKTSSKAQATCSTQAHGQQEVTWPENPFSDPTMAHLVMSWYWAGYYTGLHQGRQE